MFKNIVIGLLIVTVFGAVGVAALDARNQVTSAEVPAATPTTEAAPVQSRSQTGAGNGTGPILQTEAGDPWFGEGQIASLDATGLTLILDDQTRIYVELGPATYWQAQNITLTVGDQVSIHGFYNGTNYHAGTLITADGAQLNLRSAAGQPLWSGGQNNGQDANAQGTATGEPQIAPEDWLTLEAVVTEMTANGLTVQFTDGQVQTLQLGRADFWQQQDATFAAGDAVTIQAFYQGDQLQVGQITSADGLQRLMLRDPNGRPLWGGPGRSGSGSGGNGGTGGNGNGGGNGGNGNGNGSGGNGAGGNGNGRGGNGNGNGRGGNGNGNGNGGNNRGQGNSSSQ